MEDERKIAIKIVLGKSKKGFQYVEAQFIAGAMRDDVDTAHVEWDFNMDGMILTSRFKLVSYRGNLNFICPNCQRTTRRLFGGTSGYFWRCWPCHQIPTRRMVGDDPYAPGKFGDSYFRIPAHAARWKKEVELSVLFDDIATLKEWIREARFKGDLAEMSRHQSMLSRLEKRLKGRQRSK